MLKPQRDQLPRPRGSLLTWLLLLDSLLLQDLPDVQELITQVRSEKCSLQAAAILGEPPP